MQTNKGINKEILESVNICGDKSEKMVYNIALVEKLIKLMSAGFQVRT